MPSSSFIVRIPFGCEPSAGQRKPKRENDAIREATPLTSERPSSSCESTLASLAHNSSMNNNIKTATASGTRHETNAVRSRSTKNEVSIKTAACSLEQAVSKGRRLTFPPLENKTLSATRDSKSKSAASVRVITDVSGNSNRKITELKKPEQKLVEETRKSEGKNRSCPESLNDEIISVVIPNKWDSASKKDSKDTKEAKGKQKRKLKAVSKKEEKDKTPKIRGNLAAKSRDEEGTFSDDSCSDGSSDKCVSEVRTQQFTKVVNRTRQGSLPNIQLVSSKEPQTSSKPTAEVVDSGKDKGKRNKSATLETTGGKAKKGEVQLTSGAGRPRNLEVSLKNQDTASKQPSNANSPNSAKASEIRQHPGATSPHAIAAAVMSLALGKNMQGSSRQNSFDEQDLSKCKAYTKSSALSSTLSSDSSSPAPSSLSSGSSRSSSYSSMVSSESSSGGEQVKAAGAKGSNVRVKGTKSIPLDGGQVPPWTTAGNVPLLETTDEHIINFCRPP